MNFKDMNRRDFFKGLFLLIGGFFVSRWMGRLGRKEKTADNLKEAKFYSSSDKLLG